MDPTGGVGFPPEARETHLGAVCRLYFASKTSLSLGVRRQIVEQEGQRGGSGDDPRLQELDEDVLHLRFGQALRAQTLLQRRLSHGLVEGSCGSRRSRRQQFLPQQLAHLAVGLEKLPDGMMGKRPIRERERMIK